MRKLPSPCIDVCKFKRQGHCIGCSMTKAQKKTFKKLDKEKHREAFFAMLLEQQARLGKYKGWTSAFLRKCAKRGVDPGRIGL